jgi:hypothetical protein
MIRKSAQLLLPTRRYHVGFFGHFWGVSSTGVGLKQFLH